MSIFETSRAAGQVVARCLLASVAAALFAAPACAGRLGWVVGNQRCGDLPALRSAVNDARLIGTELAQAGFRLSVSLNVDRDALAAAARDMLVRARAEDDVVIYLSGHVAWDMQARMGYFLPEGGEHCDPANPTREGMELAGFIHALSQRARFTLVIIDAARPAAQASMGSELHGLDALSRTAVLVYSTAARFGGLGGLVQTGPTSAFAQELVRLMRIPGLPIEELFERLGRVSPPVAGVWSGPVPLTHLPRDATFYFYPAPGPSRFPWPPPRASSEAVLSPTLLQSSARGTIGGVALVLETALQAAGYRRWSYSPAPGGFALVGQLEQVQSDGTPSPEPARWSGDLPGAGAMTLLEFVKALASAPEGRYRVVVFLISDEPWRRNTPGPTSRDAEGWLSDGLNRLPTRIRDLPLSADHVTTALVYEFRKRRRDEDARFIETGQLAAQQHLEKAGIAAALTQVRQTLPAAASERPPR